MGHNPLPTPGRLVRQPILEPASPRANIACDYANRVSEQPPLSVAARLFRSVWRQSALNPACPKAPRLDGAIALVTGGARGIGLETSYGLAARGCELVLVGRDAKRALEAKRVIESSWGGRAHCLRLDLSDLQSVRDCAAQLADLLAGRKLDILIANAGLWPVQYSQSAQGSEAAFATNVLGHFALIQGLLRRELLARGARVIVVTGDIYIMAVDCTPDFSYARRSGGQLAYCRSKLGDLWLMRELARRQPELRVHAVHPGVIASELAGPSDGIAGAIKRAVLLSPKEGAQTSLFCATAPKLDSGTYYHNTLGQMRLRDDDPAADGEKSEVLWKQLLDLAGPYIEN